MGLAQHFRFKYKKIDLEKILIDLGYNLDGNWYIKKEDSFEIEVAIEPFGLYVHRSGEYFYELGNLVENLGTITSILSIEDQ